MYLLFNEASVLSLVGHFTITGRAEYYLTKYHLLRISYDKWTYIAHIRFVDVICYSDIWHNFVLKGDIDARQ